VIRNLPHQCRQVFARHRCEGESLQQIASDLSITVDTAREYLGKADKRVRESRAGRDASSHRLSRAEGNAHGGSKS
jgi:DNA-directed RNA polymerase specialized sigma24 family protein